MIRNQCDSALSYFNIFSTSMSSNRPLYSITGIMDPVVFHPLINDRAKIIVIDFSPLDNVFYLHGCIENELSKAPDAES